MKILRRLQRLWCRYTHRTEWYLYGGFYRRGPFVHCCACGHWYGDQKFHTGRGIRLPHAPQDIRLAAERIVDEEPL